ncbi:polysaccharide pyruvyl transferase family protein [Phytoactinopolyspora alkaliphila]|uniref:Polysaccharide pyruvyl transferase family protein n=1 Tax=Phytoactinopolyspora alkaliphila TaxID=1783498 RepID=A0A6N9YJJ2_9ACTN|nr:polysaccharide pyruvyl transferase family protein [Phytoactinopolyspora alkaliphila]NED95090.1 polysaccharide pyruvyl transferase family protein [Phytoactinopolyspora alkaliphila]
MGGIQLCLAGASIGNGNRGVEALGRSVLDVIDVQAPGSRLSAFDDGWGVRVDTSGRYQGSEVEFVGVRLSRRWHRPESWAQIRVAQRLGGLGNPAARRIARSDAVLDISGGDSFTDLYGETRLRSVSAPKEAALRAGRPLVLLPQTYGPFNTVSGRRLAERLVRSAALAYARDPASYERLLELAGSSADPARLRSGVDVAFALEPRRPSHPIAELIEGLPGAPVAGVNISGLLRDAAAIERFGLVGDYVATMADVVRSLVDSGAHVVLVPHVHVPGGGGESDIAAISAVVERLPESARQRLTVVPSELDAAEMKWCIAQCDWFVGSRMHATIAALSTRVPACGYAYSDKTHGVFDTCGVGHHVVDARRVSGAEAVEAMVTSFATRDAVKHDLDIRVPEVVERARQQLTDILDDVRAWKKGLTLGAIA